jgi:anti-sigma B factor antagonist
MLEYKIRRTREVTILDLSGRISVGEALAFGPGSGTVLSDVIRDLASQGHRKILLNLQDVKYIDSSGMGDLMRSFTGLQRLGGDLRLLSPASRVLEVLQATRLHKVLKIEDDEVSAIEAFSKSVAS